MKPVCHRLFVVGLLFLLCSAPAAFGMEKETSGHAIYSWRTGPGPADHEGSTAPGGWPGLRPRYNYPPHVPFHPYYYPPYYYEREKKWYEGDLPRSAGRLMFLVDPVQAEAFVNGYRLSRHADLSYEISLLAGEHHLEVRAEGYEPHQRTIEIRGGEQIRLIIYLEPETLR